MKLTGEFLDNANSEETVFYFNSPWFHKNFDVDIIAHKLNEKVQGFSTRQILKKKKK